MAKRRFYFCVEMPTPGAGRGASYGCSLKRSEAEAALERGRRRGMKRLEIVERATKPRGVRGWLAPLGK